LLIIWDKLRTYARLLRKSCTATPYLRAISVREKAGDRSQICEGTVFRAATHCWKLAGSAHGLHRDSIAAILKIAAARTCRDTTNIAGRSAWAGMATQAALNGASERSIARTTRYRSRHVLRRYIRPGELFRDNAAASLGL
jgi:hypothetical protein